MPNFKMTPLPTFTLTILTVLLACSFAAVQPVQSVKQLTESDSLTLDKYKYEIAKQFVVEHNADSLTNEQIDSILYESRLGFIDSKVTYSPDSSFKIFVIQLESCGGYCNSIWYSWTHFNIKNNEIIKTADFNDSNNNFTTIDTIYILPDKKYLVIESSYARPASVLTVSCREAKLISFTTDSMLIHPIKYNNQDNFGFCQENGVQSNKQPFIKYDKNKKLLTYYYGNNYAYSNGIDTDTIRQGRFKYIKGQFILEKETITVRPPTDNEK